MTTAERQEIIDAILSALKTNAKDISQLPSLAAASISTDTSFEVSGQRRISFAALRQALNLWLRDNYVKISKTKDLSTNDFTDELLAKLNGIAEGANNYVHPATHPASMIDTDSEHRFVTDAILQALQPNLVGEFSQDSTPEDWYWWPNGVKTTLPVDPVTKRFALHWPDELAGSQTRLFSGGNDADKKDNTTLVRLESLPLMKNCSHVCSCLKACEIYPMFDGIHMTSIGYILISSAAPRNFYFSNTENVKEFDMVVNTPNTSKLRIYGLDFSAATKIQNFAFGLYTCTIFGKNLGKAAGLTTADFSSRIWGDDTKSPDARKSLIDTLLTNSFNRAAAGYSATTLQLSEYTRSLLTEAEVQAITAKGYTITTK